jgi:cytochrome c oxidase assembly protein subunit 15
VLALAVTLQATLGILTLLYVAPLPLALAHQGMALVVLTLATLYAARLTASRGQPVEASALAKTVGRA